MVYFFSNERKIVESTKKWNKKSIYLRNLNMNTFSAWIEAIRPRTLPLSIAGIIVGSAASMHDKHWNNGVFILALTTTLLFQILSNLANDLGDSQKGADNENRLGPVRAIQSGNISSSAMKKAVVLVASLGFIAAILLIYQSVAILTTRAIIFYIILAILCILAAITYTVGKKAYGYSGFGDVFVFVFFGLVSVMGVYPLYSSTLPAYLILPAVAIGMLSTAVLNLNNMRDHENDAAVNKRTLVVKIGFVAAKNYQILLIVVATIAWIIFILCYNSWTCSISFLPFVILFKHLLFVHNCSEAKTLDSQLKVVALSTFAIAILYFCCTVFYR
jgi:1,4-dihydroxy-2-naphthoate octaprenyltransferase